MPARNSKGRFVKGGGKRRKSGGGAVVKYRTRNVTKYRTRHVAAPRRRRGGRKGGGGGINLIHAGIAAAGLAYVTSDTNGIQTVREWAGKIPGSKTFGNGAALGLACLAVDRFVKPNKWLKLAGMAGVILAASQVGKQGSGFKWVGDDDSEDVADLDIGDADDGEYDDGDQ